MRRYVRLPNQDANVCRFVTVEDMPLVPDSVAHILAWEAKALAYVATVPKFLKRFGANGFDAKIQEISYAPPLKQIRMTWAALRGRI